MIYIYITDNSPRVEYTLEVLMHRILMCEYKVVRDISAFKSIRSGAPRINYSNEKIEGSLWMRPHGLLSEEGVRPQDIEVHYQDTVPYFFQTSDGGVMVYDLFASSFYMLSRYEEYLSFKPDIHGRFPASESLAFKTGFLRLPVVHLWMERLKKEILQLFPAYTFPPLTFRVLDTVDIDYAYRFKGKGFLRNAAGLVKDILSGNATAVQARLKYYKSGSDPYDTYDYIQQIQEKESRERLFFIQTGQYGKYDKNLPFNTVMRNLVYRLSAYSEIGIHPSYKSGNKAEIIRKEKEKIERLTGSLVTKSRQHYLRLSFPATYEQLIEAGIEEDYSMGYASMNGFRAGMALPYPFYHLLKESTEPLTIVPFQVMDVAMKDYLGMTPEQAVDEVRYFKQTIERIGGLMVSVFHNSSLSEESEWEGWRQVYNSL